VEEIPKAIAQSLDGVTRVATLVRAMKEFAHPDQKEKAAANINEALVSTLTVARNELKYVAEVETDFGDLPAHPLQYQRTQPGLSQLAGQCRSCHRGRQSSEPA
jgi:hypothetical protein